MQAININAVIEGTQVRIVVDLCFRKCQTWEGWLRPAVAPPGGDEGNPSPPGVPSTGKSFPERYEVGAPRTPGGGPVVKTGGWFCDP